MTPPVEHSRQSSRIHTVYVEASVDVKGARAHVDRALEAGFPYEFKDRNAVLAHLAYNAVANGVEDANRLDGWADLPSGTLTMQIRDVDPQP
jgi:hypothetical protein